MQQYIMVHPQSWLWKLPFIAQHVAPELKVAIQHWLKSQPLIYMETIVPTFRTDLFSHQMCYYTDKVYRCGHYQRSCDPCHDAKQKQSLCEPPKKGKKGGGANGNMSYPTGTWCDKEDCDGKAKNKREGLGTDSINALT